MRLFQNKQSDQGLPVFYSDKHFMNLSPDIQHFIYEKKEKIVQNFKTFTILNTAMTLIRLH